MPTLQQRASFDEVFTFYRDSGFLYPAKLAALAPRMAALERTWQRLLADDAEVFRLFVNRAPSGELLNAICAFEYAPGSWQGQHLVSRRRHEYLGTLAVLSDLVRWFHDAGVCHARLSFRPNNPGTNQLFGSVAQRLPAHLAHLAVVDYALVAPEAKRLPRPAVDIERLAPADAQVAVAFYSQLLHPVELAALHLDELELDGLAASFADHGLHRRRRVLVATGGSGVLGACIVNEASEGINFSFLENAIEHLRVAPGLSARRRRQVWLALAAAALDTARERHEDAVATLEPADRDLALDAGLISERPKQYAVLTVTREERGFLRSIECFDAYYEALRASR
jgi:hypothetical protein